MNSFLNPFSYRLNSYETYFTIDKSMDLSALKRKNKKEKMQITTRGEDGKRPSKKEKKMTKKRKTISLQMTIKVMNQSKTID